MGICYGMIDNEDSDKKQQPDQIIEKEVVDEQTSINEYKFEDFKFLKLLGKGVFGKVILTEHIKTKQLFAVKIIEKANIEQSFIESEHTILQQSQNSFIIKLYFTFEDENKIYLGTEFVNGGELFIHLRKNYCFSEERTRFYTAELILALKYLHESGVIYRDLKPENILIDQWGHIKLTDFGLSKIKFHKITYTILGTPEYVAPEILLEQGYNETVDWYSLGILVYEMLSGAPPFYSKDQNLMIEQRMTNPLVFSSEIFSQNAIDLIQQLTKLEASKRLGSQGPDEIMRHPFFEGINFDVIQKRQIEPPFRPQLEGRLDLKYFDPQILDQAIEFD